MLKVFIADDEYYFRQALKASIDWESNGFTICGEARDGEDALEKICMLKPDIVLLDINMPMMNGLEVMQMIKETEIGCKVIIITGHDEFDYALQAIQLGVSNFILKPIDKKQLLNALNDIKDLITQKRNLSIEMDCLKTRLEQNLPQLRDQMLHSLIYGNATIEKHALIEKMRHLGIDLLASKIMVTVMEIDYDDNWVWDEHDRSLWMQAILEIVEKIILEKIQGAICFDNEEKICVMLGFEDPSDEDILAKVIPKLYQIKDAVEEHLDFTVTIGVGGIYNGIENITLSYDEAINALSNRIIVGSNQIIPFKTISENRLSVVFYTTEYRQQLLIALRLLDASQCYTILDHVFENIKASCTSPELIRITCIGIISTGLEFMAETKISVSKEAGLDLAGIFETIQTIKKIDEMKEYIKRVISGIVDNVSRNKKAAISKFVEKALEYIHDNYANEDMNIKEIAEHVYVNYGHLCFLFKRETGMTMNDYIVNYRMNKAKELIENGANYIADISNRVGYINPNYFGKCFKKHFGLSPSTFIEQVNK